MNTPNKSTYSLLVRSEEKNRSVLEIILYTLFLLSAVTSIWQFAQQPVTLPNDVAPPCVACVGTPENAHS